MPTTYANGFAPTGPAPETWRDALAAILNGDHTMSMAGGSPSPMGGVLANALAQPPGGGALVNALAQPLGGGSAGVLPHPSGGTVMTPTTTTAEEGPQPRLVNSGGDSTTLPMPSSPSVPLDLTGATAKHPGFFAPGGVGRAIIGTLSDAALTATGNQPVYWPRKMQMQQQAREDARLKLAEARETRIANRPVFNSLPNIGLVATDPDTGTSNVIQPARSAARAYVEDDLGLKPTDPEYHVALADYLLKANGPTAFGYRSALQDDRQAATADLQDDRQAAAVEAMRTRLGLNEKLASYREGLRRSRPAAPRAAGGDPHSTNAVVARILLKMSHGQPITPGEQQVLDYNRSRGRGGGGIPNGQGQTVTPGGGAPRIPGTRENPAILGDPAERVHLPKGTYYRDPQGNVRMKQ